MTQKSFPTLHVASCLTGIGLSDSMSYSDIMAVASHLFGDSIYTHEIIHEPTRDAYVSEGYRQFPDMPTPAEAQADFRVAAARAVAAYGERLTVRQGTHRRRESPVATLGAMVPPEKIIVVKGGD